MRLLFIRLTALLLAPFAAPAQQPSVISSVTVRDLLRIFTVTEGGNNKKSPTSTGGNTKHYPMTLLLAVHA
jgi:hypothetical protein